MQIVTQQLDEIMNSLSSLEADWMDDIAEAIVARLQIIPVKPQYRGDDIDALMSVENRSDFHAAKLCAGLFLGLSKDKFESELKERLGTGGTGIQRFKADHQAFLAVLEDMGLCDAMTATINRKLVWSDILKERLRFGRGSAIQGQQRGRGLEDFAENIIQNIFHNSYEVRCTFQGINGSAKCDFAIPGKERPCILIEVKGYGATGSKMSDIIGDIDAIIRAKRPDARLLLLTDGLTWRSRKNDLKKLIQRQNNGLITRIYTKRMADKFRTDLVDLKNEYRI